LKEDGAEKLNESLDHLEGKNEEDNKGFLEKSKEYF